jgi:uncharacterized protein with beta-barrel porin domain
MNTAFADVGDVLVSTDQDLALTIELSGRITNLPDGVTATGVTISQPANGQAQVVAGELRVVYTPNSGYIGPDTFEYFAQLSDNTTQGPATVKIVVGGVDAPYSGESPGAVINDTFSQQCLEQVPEGSLVDFCEPFLIATAGTEADLREFLDALSPKEIAAQSDLGNDMARQQVESVIKRLVALRKGMTQSALGNLALNIGGKTFTWDQLRGATGGAASADQSKTGNLGWYINGNINYGGTEETEKEDAYTFASGNLTTGLDYRFSQMAVLGGALGFGGTGMEIDNDGGNMDVSGVTGTLYASFFPTQRLNIDIVQSFNYQEFSTSRRIIYGDTDDTAKSSTNSALYMGSLGFGYQAFIAGGFTWSLGLRGDYLKSTIDGYEETGNSIYNLSIEERSVEQVNSDLNNNFTFANSYNWGVMVHQFDVSWIYQFKGDAEIIRGSFIEDPESTVFEFTTDPPDSNYFKLAYGLQSIWAGGNTLYFQLQTTLAKENYFDVGLAAGFRTEF